MDIERKGRGHYNLIFKREYAESILEVFTEANEKWVEQCQGEAEMGPALMRIVESELCEAKKQGIERQHFSCDFKIRHWITGMCS